MALQICILTYNFFVKIENLKSEHCTTFPGFFFLNFFNPLKGSEAYCQYASNTTD